MENHIYQGIKLKYFDREKQYIQDWAATIVENILSSIDRRFGKLDGSSHDVTAEVKEGDDILFRICRILNTNVFPSKADEEILVLQIESLTFIYGQFKEVPLLERSTLSGIVDGYIDIVSYMTQYYPINSMNRKEFWMNVFRLGKNKGREE